MGNPPAPELYKKDTPAPPSNFTNNSAHKSYLQETPDDSKLKTSRDQRLTPKKVTKRRGSEVRASESFLLKLSATGRERRKSSDNALGQASLLRGYSGPIELDDDEGLVPDDPPPCYSMLDLWLTLLHTFMYMFLYYGAIPGSKDQAEALGMSAGITGVLNACTPIGAGLSCFQYNWHTNTSYHKGYIFSWCS